MAKLKNKISFFVLPIFFTCLLLTFFMFNNNVSVLADNTISADETTNNSFSVNCSTGFPFMANKITYSQKRKVGFLPGTPA